MDELLDYYIDQHISREVEPTDKRTIYDSRIEWCS